MNRLSPKEVSSKIPMQTFDHRAYQKLTKRRVLNQISDFRNIRIIAFQIHLSTIQNNSVSSITQEKIGL